MLGILYLGCLHYVRVSSFVMIHDSVLKFSFVIIYTVMSMFQMLHSLVLSHTSEKVTQ